ncbi:MAG: energy transducer TonB [Melioribacteraceae bacterium]|nr:energy transducer TonB [Melioribacteraceae bacterium]
MKSISLFLIGILFFSGSTFGQEELDEMPQIKGGIMELAKNIKYPKASKKEGIEGTVFVNAVIDAEGNVSSAKVEKGVDENLDAAAVKAVKMTKFIPGVKDGKKVKAEVTIPIKFKLDDKKKKDKIR